MIAVDTSALIIILDEPEAATCIEALTGDPHVIISAGTLAEALVVAARTGRSPAMAELIENFRFAVIEVTAATARGVVAAYVGWGRGVHPAGLNLGDCFAYELATTRGCPLVCIGNDFVKTDVMLATA